MKNPDRQDGKEEKMRANTIAIDSLGPVVQRTFVSPVPVEW